MGSHKVFDDVDRVGWDLIVGLLVGMGLHLIRYYDALIGKLRARRRSHAEPGAHMRGWPRSSADADFLLQIAVTAAVVSRWW